MHLCIWQFAYLKDNEMSLIFQSSLLKQLERLSCAYTQLKAGEARQKARLMTALALALLVVTVVVAPIWVISAPDFVFAPYMLLGMLAGLVLTYGLSRSRLHCAAPAVLVLLLLLLVEGVILTAPGTLRDRMLVLPFLILPVMISSMFMQYRFTLTVVTIGLGVISSFFFSPEVPFRFTFAYLVFFLAITALGGVGAIMSRRYQQLSAESEERYQSVIAALSEGIIMQMQDGTIQACNAAAERILGLTAEQLVGRTPIDPGWYAIHEDGSPFPGDTHPAMVTLRTGQPVSDVIMGIYQPNRDLQWISVNSQPLTHPGTTKPYAVVTSFTDITGRKQHDRALAEAQHRYFALFRQAHDAVFILNLEGQHLEANWRAADLLGYTIEEIQNLTFKDLSAEHKDSQDMLRRLLDGEHIPVYERIFRKKDGILISVEISVELVHDLDGNPLHIQSVVRDVTERKKGEMLKQAFLDDMKALQQIHLELSEIEDVQTLYQKMIEMTQQRLGIDRVGLFMLNREGTRIEGIYGVATDGTICDKRYYQEDITPDHWTLDLVTKPQRVNFWDNVDIIDNGVVVGTGWRIAAALWDGQEVLGYLVIDNFVTHRPVRAYKTELISLLGSTFGHLIGRKQAEETLRHQSHFLQTIIESVTCPFYVINVADYTIEMANSAAHKLGIIEKAKTTCYALTHKRGTPCTGEHVCPLHTVLATKAPATVEHIHYDQNGNPLQIEIRGYPIFDDDGNVVQMIEYSLDITARKQAEEAQRQSEKRLRSLVDAIPDMVFRISGDGTYLDFHVPSTDDLIAPPDQLIGRTIMDVLPPEPAEIHTHFINQALRTGEEQTYEYTLPIGGQSVDFEARMVGTGQDEVVAIVRNITERKQASRREFELALERERVSLLRQFIEKASHEFRTPLSIITSAAFLISRVDDPENRHHKANSIHDQVIRITRLVDMLLLMVRLESSTAPIFSSVDIGMLIDAVCQNMVERHGERPTLVRESTRKLTPIKGSFEDLLEALTQILDNAYRNTPADGTITVATGVEDDHIWLEIRDTGIGIDEASLLHIFDTFWRLDEAHTMPGFGLGLPIAQKVIQMHGGTLGVESNTSEGTCFRIVLPAATQPTDSTPV